MEPSQFTQQWTIEVIRQREVHWGLCADSQAMRLARQQPTLARQLYSRAHTLAQQQSLLTALQQFRLLRNVLLTVLALVAVMTGMALANTVLSRGPGTVSLLDALILLLAFNTIALIIWLASFCYRGGGQGVGGALLQLMRACIKGPAMAAVIQAFMSLAQRAGLLRLGFSSISHGFWLLLLGSAFMTLWIRFLGQQYEFTWQTTILSESAVQSIIAYLNILPGTFGIEAPAAALLNDQPGLLRQQSATWLLACLALYGVLPRLILLVGTELMRFRNLQRLSVDASLPGLAELAPRFRYTPTAIIDPAPRTVNSHRGTKMTVPVTGETAVVLSLEHDIDSEALTLPADARYLGMIASGEQRQQLLSQFAAGDIKRTLVIIDSRLSADRGSLRFLAEIAQHSSCAAWLNHSDAAVERATYWREQLSDQLAITVFESEETAMSWLSETVHE